MILKAQEIGSGLLTWYSPVIIPSAWQIVKTRQTLSVAAKDIAQGLTTLENSDDDEAEDSRMPSIPEESPSAGEPVASSSDEQRSIQEEQRVIYQKQRADLIRQKTSKLSLDDCQKILNKFCFLFYKLEA